MKEHEILKIIYAYKIHKEAGGSEKPFYEILHATLENGYFLKRKLLELYKAYVEDDSCHEIIFYDLEELNNFLIEASGSLRVKKIYFINLQDFNYSLENAAEISDMKASWEKFASKWTKQKSKTLEGFSLKNIFS